MSSIDDILKAFGAFNQGMQHYAVASGINEATSQVDQLKQQQLSQLEQRKQQEQIAKNLALKLTSFGADQNDVGTAYNAIAPQKFTSPDQIAQAALQSGDMEMMKLAKEAQAFHVQPKVDSDAREYTQKRNLQQAQIESNEKIAGIRAGGKNSRPVPSGQVEKIQQLADLEVNSDLLLESFNQHKALLGPVGGRVPLRDITNPEFAAFKAEIGRFFNAYRIPVTGAGAAMKELDTLKKDLVSMTDTSEAFEKKLKRFIEVQAQVKASRVNTLEKFGYNVDRLKEEAEERVARTRTSQPTSALPPEIPKGSKPVMHRKKDGTEVPAWRLPDGRIAIPK